MGRDDAWRWQCFWFLCVRFDHCYIRFAYQKLDYRGNIDLPHLFPWLGGTQLEVLVIFTSFFLLFTHGITAWCVKEVPFVDL